MHIMTNRKLQAVIENAVKEGIKEYGAEAVQREEKLLQQTLKLRSECVPHKFEALTLTSERLERNYSSTGDVVGRLTDTRQRLVCIACGEMLDPW